MSVHWPGNSLAVPPEWKLTGGNGQQIVGMMERCMCIACTPGCTRHITNQIIIRRSG